MAPTRSQRTKEAKIKEEAVQEKEEAVQEMDTTEKEEDTTALKKRSPIPVYLTCKLCQSVYTDPVRPTCCSGAKACRGCAESHLADDKKCWNPECLKDLQVDDLVDQNVLGNHVEAYKARETKFKEGLKTGAVLRCTVCDEICKRGVVLPCCGAPACRGCAVKKVTANRSCWMECKKSAVNSEDLINDELLRSAIDNFKKEGIVDEDQARQLIWNGKLKLKTYNKKNKTKKKKAKDIYLQFYISGLPEDTSKQEIRDSFAKFGETGRIIHNADMKTATLVCGNADTANGILKERGNIKVGESVVNVELSSGGKNADLTLRLTGMALDSDENDIKDMLGKYGNLKYFKISKTEKDGEENICAYIKFETQASLKKLLDDQDLELNGDSIKVSLLDTKIKKKEPKGPMVQFKGIFLKKDEGELLKFVEEKFGVIGDSTFFMKDLEEIPDDAEKLSKKERFAISSHVRIQFRKQNATIKAILDEKLAFNGHTFAISHVKGSGGKEFITKLAERQEALRKQKAETPLVSIKGIFLKEDEGDIVSLLEKFGAIEEYKFFTRDLEKLPANAEKLTGKERKKIISRGVIQFKKAVKAITAIVNEEVVHNGHTIFISHVTGTGSESFKTKLAEKKEAIAKKKKEESTKAQAVKRDSRGMQKNGWDNAPFFNNAGNGAPGYQNNFSRWSSYGYGMPYGPTSLEMRMRSEAMKYNMSSSSYFGGGPGGMFSNGGGPGGMWGGQGNGVKQSRFNQDFTKVTGMSGAKKAKRN